MLGFLCFFIYLITEVHIDEILEGAGYILYKICKEAGYCEIIKTLAVDLTTFLFSLNSFFDYLASHFSKMQPPVFCIGIRNDASLILHYYSQRKGLEYFLVGIMKTIVKGIYHINVNLEVLTRKVGNWDGGKYMYQVSFDVKGL